jgi:N-acetylglucosamine repressor
VGVGIVVNGEVVRGKSHGAGEFGHIPISFDGPRCLCGGRGCWESYTSNLTTLCRYLDKELSPAEARLVMQRGELTMTELITRARTGDAKAKAALMETGRYLAIGLVMVINALNPAQIFVGGEITAVWDLVEPIIRKAVAEQALTPSAAETPIIPEQMGGYPRLRGATALVAAPLFAAPRIA